MTLWVSTLYVPTAFSVVLQLFTEPPFSSSSSNITSLDRLYQFPFLKLVLSSPSTITLDYVLLLYFHYGAYQKLLLFDHSFIGVLLSLKYKSQESRDLVFLVTSVSSWPRAVRGTLATPGSGVNGAP